MHTEHSDRRTPRTAARQAACGLCLAIGLSSATAGAAVYTVTNTGDSGPGSLRDAMTQADANPGLDQIVFSIPGSGVQTISPLSQLPAQTDQAGVTIDGLTQPGASAGGNPPSSATLLIELDGTNAGASHGIWILSSNNLVQGLIINRWQQDGIRIQGTPASTANNLVYCNFIGTDPNGTVGRSNGQNQQMLWAGVNILVPPGAPGLAHDNVVDRNLVSDCYAEGVSISNCPPGDVFMNHVTANLIGTDVSGLVGLGNIHCDVYIGESAHDNVVFDNTICDAGFQGVCIVGYAEAGLYTNRNFVDHNRIGVGVDWTTPIPNQMDGVSIGVYGTTWYRGGFAEENVVMDNIIAHNRRHGVMVWEHYNNQTNADHNQITANSIFDNQLLGIDLDDDMVTANDPGDPDTGANQQLNMPVIQQAVYAGGSTTIGGTIDINSDPTQAVVEVFKARQDPTGFGEGENYLGMANPDAAGNWSTTVSGLVPNDWVTATTTDLALNTSEFANCLQVTGGNVPPVCNAGGPYSGLVGRVVQMNGGASYDPDGTIISYDWQFGDGTTGAGVTPSHVYLASSVYLVSLTVIDNAGASSTCSSSANITATDWADHDIGNCILTVTDQGILGFMDSGQAQGSGFVFPASDSNLVFIGGLWVGESTSYVANRDYDDDPDREWRVAGYPDGHVRIDLGGSSDQDIHACYTDSSAMSPRGLFVRQESWAWATTPRDDFVIIRYVVGNHGSSTLSNLYVGQFLDIDIGIFTQNTGGTDGWRRLAYVTGGTEQHHVGAMLLCGGPDPDPIGNVTLIDNHLFVHPNGYVLDADKYGFLSAASSQYVLPGTTTPEDYGVLVSAGPLSLAPGDSNEVAVAILGGQGLADLLANADAAISVYCSGCGVDGPVEIAAPTTRLLPNQPNPFNPMTTIRFELAEAGRVRVGIYDPSGRRVAAIADGHRESGRHALTWDGRDDGGRAAASGIYFVRLETASRVDSRRVVLLK